MSGKHQEVPSPVTGEGPWKRAGGRVGPSVLVGVGR